ncbi:hypothetical protein SAMN05216558_3448 [Pseudomonas vancouverensis]|nr:hypothetical protein SAMN05216558_3448 [Pseudomonas vancouverensis]
MCPPCPRTCVHHVSGPYTNAKKEPKGFAPAYGPSLRLGVPSLRDPSGGIAYGLLRCTSSRCVWLRQTVAALPPPDESLHSACRRGRQIKSCTRANAHRGFWFLVFGEREGGAALVLWGDLPLTPALSRREREPTCMLFKPEFNALLHVGVFPRNTSISSLSLWERARVRGS